MRTTLFPISCGRRQLSAHWFLARDGDDDAREIFRRHYSYRPYADGRDPKQFCGPGEKMVLLNENGTALFVWRLFRSADGQEGINCAVFRNEDASALSSALILEAEIAAWTRWPPQRLFTYVNPRKIKSRNPGFCFLAAGWQRAGETKWNRLLILEKPLEK